MKTITIIEPSDVKYLKIDVGPRYWEDSEINGVDDISWDEQSEGMQPRMPFATYNEEKAATHKGESYRWELTIDLTEGKILDWPVGLTAKIHYKICDDGTYYLMDENKNILIEKNCYVPDILAYQCDGWGDYIIMTIDENGKILNYPQNPSYLIQELIDTESF